MDSTKFWLQEDPELLTTDKNAFRYYPKAGRLVVHLPDYDRGGSPHVGKGVGIQLGALTPEVCERLIEILATACGIYPTPRRQPAPRFSATPLDC